MVSKIDLTNIPKTILWIGITIFTLLILFTTYLVVSYKAIKPYQKHLEIECVYSNGTSVAILTAKTHISNITILDFSNNIGCRIERISKNSMDGCKFNSEPIGGIYYIKVRYEVDNETYSAISKCKIIREKKSILDILKLR